MVRPYTGILPENKPYLLLEGTAKDFLTVENLGTEHLFMCPRCGTPVTHSTKIIYVAVENMIVCVKCARKWLDYATWRSDEVKKEKDYYDSMVQKLKDSKLWME